MKHVIKRNKIKQWAKHKTTNKIQAINKVQIQKQNHTCENLKMYPIEASQLNQKQ